jgi:tetratricopeptide (TPR) repeat protein
MRRLGLLLAAAACAHAPARPRSGDPANWVELQSEHFLVRSDLPPEEAKKSVAGMELARAALLAVGWHAKAESRIRTVVVQLAGAAEMEEFAPKGVGGFAGYDAFEQPLIVIHGANVLDETLFKHELTHVISAGFLLTMPRWVNEGIACYLETLQITGPGQAVVGKVDEARGDYIARRPIRRWFGVITGGAEMLSGDVRGYAFESGAWALIRYFLETSPDKLDLYFQELAKGTEGWRAFTAAFPGLREEDLSTAMRAFLDRREVKLSQVSFKPWSGEVAMRALPAAEVYALRADLLRASVATTHRPEAVAAELKKALAADPANPYALMLDANGDPKLAVAAHPDDWRSWIAAADRNGQDRPDLERAAALAPDDPGVLARLAAAEGRAQDRVLALRHATHAAELAPGRSDVLRVLAFVQADNGLCAEALVNAQRAIDSFPDATVARVPASLLESQGALQAYCDVRTAADQQQKNIKPAPPYDVVKPVSCKRKPPKLANDLRVDLTITEAGTARRVDFSDNDDTTRPLRIAVRAYLESCKYEPVIFNGKATEARKATVLSRQK